MNVATILQILQLAGTETPAFIALFNEVKNALSTSDQAALDQALVDSNAVADAQHQAAQSL